MTGEVAISPGQSPMCLAVPGRIESLSEAFGTSFGRVDFGGVARDVCLALVPDAAPGDWVLVHVGFALARLDETSALSSRALLAEAGLLDDGVAADPAACPAPMPGERGRGAP